MEEPLQRGRNFNDHFCDPLMQPAVKKTEGTPGAWEKPGLAAAPFAGIVAWFCCSRVCIWLVIWLCCGPNPTEAASRGRGCSVSMLCAWSEALFERQFETPSELLLMLLVSTVWVPCLLSFLCWAALQCFGRAASGVCGVSHQCQQSPSVNDTPCGHCQGLNNSHTATLFFQFLWNPLHFSSDV